MSTAVPTLEAALDDALAWVAQTELGSTDVMTAFVDLERFRNRLALLDHALINRAQAVALAERHCFSSLERLLVRALRISPGEARRRVRAAETLSPRSVIEATTGLPLPSRPPRFTVLAAAQAAGDVSPEQVGLVERALADIDIAHPDALIDAEVTLTDYARAFAPPELRRICHHLVETIDSDGQQPRDSTHRDLRYVRLHHRRDGMLGLEGRLTPAAGPSSRPSSARSRRRRRPACQDRQAEHGPSPTRVTTISGCMTRSTRPAPACCRPVTCPPAAALLRR